MSKADTIDMTANPGPLGLLGFGMTTVLLNFHNAGYIPLNSVILAMGLFYGGLAQIFAGLLEWKKGNTFGTTAFTSYGIFWMTLVTLILLPKTSLGIEAPDRLTMTAFLSMWGLFTLVMFVGTLKATKALQIVFGSLAILFFLLAAGEYFDSVLITRIAGAEGILCGFSAIYTGLAQVLNEAHGKVICPLDFSRKK